MYRSAQIKFPVQDFTIRLYLIMLVHATIKSSEYIILIIMLFIFV